MIRLTYPALTEMAHALLAQRKAHAESVAFWDARTSSKVAPSQAADAKRNLAATESALIELQGAAPPTLAAFLQQQMTLNPFPTARSPEAA